MLRRVKNEEVPEKQEEKKEQATPAAGSMKYAIITEWLKVNLHTLITINCDPAWENFITMTSKVWNFITEDNTTIVVVEMGDNYYRLNSEKPNGEQQSESGTAAPSNQ